MEKKKRAVALENELELGAVAEAQVAQAEGLIQVVEAIKAHQQSFLRVIIRATAWGVTASTAAICLFLWWNSSTVRKAAELAYPTLTAPANAKEKDKSKNHRSKELLLALQDDDPSRLTPEVWEWFTGRESDIRVQNYKRLIEVGNLPKLQEWLKKIPDQ